MALTITATPDKTIAGTLITQHLKNELEVFSASSADGTSLLGPILVGDTYQVTIQSEKPTATSAKNVNINSKDTKIDIATTLDGLKEFVESTIFELTNAKNSADFAALETALETGTKQLRQFGREKAGCEAEASWNVYKILSGRDGYTPSGWGTKQIEECQKHDSLAAFKLSFIDQPHDKDATARSAPALPSNEFYAFNGAYKLGGKPGKLQAQFVTLKDKATGRTLKLEKLKNKLPNNAAINSMNPRAVTYYYVAIEFIIANSATINVVWKGAGQPDYIFTDAMKTIANDTDGVMRAAFDKAWTQSKNDLLE